MSQYFDLTAPISGKGTEKHHTEQGPDCMEGAAHISCFVGPVLGNNVRCSLSWYRHHNKIDTT